MAGQDPISIQRDIENTRAELAETIDAIADRVSPKRVASRGAARVREAVSGVLHGSNGVTPDTMLDPSYRPEPTRTSIEEVREIAAEGAGSAYTGRATYEVQQRLRTDRVLLAVGAAAVLTAVVVYLSYGRNRVDARPVRGGGGKGGSRPRR